ncbi:PBS lyase HEAT domain protein repeat-containing protein [Bradyrhizobium oligotrophicum S58]|uniref:PBS lyase HEAT domain protein repeat-containing protein n=2 Tax=Bradyrhizobium oligotrophicum TaxID=44255 RepID=M4Z8W7_9BRAD|nr:hypothetical protein [Bradyrhizobium oligotrophicum]BAM90118.1 PBS lyase HEAT domain protein repeat-containing protein [Bradyrhizobium oligotrophicum S58]
MELHSSDAITIDAFCAAFVSALVANGITSIRPRSGSARRGFQAVLNKLDKIIAETNDKDTLYDLLKIRTSLAPGLSGSYDNFEAHLRGLQTSMVSSPNPAFADLRFNVSPSYAQSALDRLDKRWSELAKSAAKEFEMLGKEMSASDERQYGLSST